MELHRVVQALLEEENKYERNMLIEKQMHELDKEEKMFKCMQVDRWNNLLKIQLEKDDNWEESHPHHEEKDNSLVLTALSHSFQVEATEKMESEKTLITGFSLAGFLSEAGWHLSAGRVYQTCSKILDQQHPGEVAYKLDLLSHLLESATFNCQIREATDLALAIQNYLSKNQSIPETCPSLTSTYKALSTFCLQRSQFDQSHIWAVKALNALSPKNPPKVTPHYQPNAAFLKGCRIKSGKVRSGSWS